MTSSPAPDHLPDHLPDQLPSRRVAVVTGSDSGMGRAIAVALAREGCDVGVTWHRDEQGAEETAEEVRSAGARAEVRHLDLTRLPEAASVVDDLAEALSDDGRLDVLVNNAGTGTATLLLEMDFSTWREVISTDLDGAFCCLQRAARRMVGVGRRGRAAGGDDGAVKGRAAGGDDGAVKGRAAGGDDGAVQGRVVNITSVHEHAPRVGAGPYCAAKGGLGLLTKVAALELAEYGITVNSVAPGEISTPMTGQEDVDPTSQDRPGIPLGRPGDAREVAAVVAFLCSDAGGYVTGSSWAVDGGMLQMGPMAGSHLTSNDWRRP